MPVDHDDIVSVLMWFCPIMNPTVMIRKSILDENNIEYKEECNSVQDYELWERLAFDYGARFHNIPKVLLQYRVHVKSISVNLKDFQSSYSITIRRKQLQRLLGDQTSRYETVFFKIEQWMPVGDLNFLEEVSDLFSALIKANRDKNIYPENGFPNFLIKFYARQCRLHAFLGIGVLRAYGDFLLRHFQYCFDLGILLRSMMVIFDVLRQIKRKI